MTQFLVKFPSTYIGRSSIGNPMKGMGVTDMFEFYAEIIVA